MTRFNVRLVLYCATLAGALLFTSCLDTIDLDAPEGISEALVIQGELIKGDPSVANVNVTRLFDFTAQSRFGVSVFSVEVFDMDGNSVRLTEGRPGEYTVEIPSSSPLQVEVGHEYFIRVASRDGRTFESLPESIVQGDEIEDLWFEINQEEIIDEFGDVTLKDKLQLFISTTVLNPEDGSPTRLKWDVRRNYKITDSPIFPWEEEKVCYIDDNPQGNNLLIEDGTTRANDRIDSLQVFESVISSFYAEGAYLTVFQQAITQTTYEYWNEVEQLLNRTGGMFEPVAGEIRTNIFNIEDPTDLTYGYFSVYVQDTARIYISPDTVGNPMEACPPMGGVTNLNGDCNVRVCCDCLDALGSSIEKPGYWEY